MKRGRIYESDWEVIDDFVIEASTSPPAYSSDVVPNASATIDSFHGEKAWRADQPRRSFRSCQPSMRQASWLESRRWPTGAISPKKTAVNSDLEISTNAPLRSADHHRDKRLAKEERATDPDLSTFHPDQLEGEDRMPREKMQGLVVKLGIYAKVPNDKLRADLTQWYTKRASNLNANQLQINGRLPNFRRPVSTANVHSFRGRRDANIVDDEEIDQDLATYHPDKEIPRVEMQRLAVKAGIPAKVPNSVLRTELTDWYSKTQNYTAHAKQGRRHSASASITAGDVATVTHSEDNTRDDPDLGSFHPGMLQGKHCLSRGQMQNLVVQIGKYAKVSNDTLRAELVAWYSRRSGSRKKKHKSAHSTGGGIIDFHPSMLQGDNILSRKEMQGLVVKIGRFAKVPNDTLRAELVAWYDCHHQTNGKVKRQRVRSAEGRSNCNVTRMENAGDVADEWAEDPDLASFHPGKLKGANRLSREDMQRLVVKIGKFAKGTNAILRAELVAWYERHKGAAGAKRARGSQTDPSYASASASGPSAVVILTRPKQSRGDDASKSNKQDTIARRVRNEVASSRYRGVVWDKTRQLWLAKFTRGACQKYLGSFNTEEAASAEFVRYREKALKLAESGTQNSKFVGVSWESKTRKWIARYRDPVSGKNPFFGRYDSDVEAAEAYARGSGLWSGQGQWVPQLTGTHSSMEVDKVQSLQGGNSANMESSSTADNHSNRKLLGFKDSQGHPRSEADVVHTGAGELASFAKTSVPLLEVGCDVDAQFRGGEWWYKGKVAKVNTAKKPSECSYDIAYDDGDFETEVPRERVIRRRKLGVIEDRPRRPDAKRFTSTHCGVSWRSSAGMWEARTTVKCATVHLGYFQSEDDAARAYDNAVRPLGKPLNFPEPGEAQAIKFGGTSHICGVHWAPQHNKWCASIFVRGKHIFLGHYKSEAEAAQRLEEARSSGEYDESTTSEPPKEEVTSSSSKTNSSANSFANAIKANADRKRNGDGLQHEDNGKVIWFKYNGSANKGQGWWWPCLLFKSWDAVSQWGLTPPTPAFQEMIPDGGRVALFCGSKMTYGIVKSMNTQVRFMTRQDKIPKNRGVRSSDAKEFKLAVEEAFSYLN